MSYFPSTAYPSVQESPSPYSPFSRKNTVYEVSLQVAPSSSWLQDLSNAHRLVQTLLQGELMGDYDLLDFLVWPGGLFTRLSLKKTPSLAECLKSLKEKSAPPEEDHRNLWQDEPRWIRLVTPDKLFESREFFLETAEAIRRSTSRPFPGIFFLYQNTRWGR